MMVRCGIICTLRRVSWKYVHYKCTHWMLVIHILLTSSEYTCCGLPPFFLPWAILSPSFSHSLFVSFPPSNIYSPYSALRNCSRPTHKCTWYMCIPSVGIPLFHFLLGHSCWRELCTAPKIPMSVYYAPFSRMFRYATMSNTFQSEEMAWTDACGKIACSFSGRCCNTASFCRRSSAVHSKVPAIGFPLASRLCDCGYATYL